MLMAAAILLALTVGCGDTASDAVTASADAGATSNGTAMPVHNTEVGADATAVALAKPNTSTSGTSTTPSSPSTPSAPAAAPASPGAAAAIMPSAAGGNATANLAGEEFVGPFPSWADLKRDYGARGDGVTDDTAAWQAALDDIGVVGKRAVLYVPAGTYRITAMLTMKGKRGVSIIGEDPQTTVVRWAGADGGTMLDIYGVAYSRFGRLTWDGAGKAGTALHHWFTNPNGGNYFPTHLEHTDEIFKDAQFCLRAGKMGGGVAEGVVKRSRFLRCSAAGVSIADWNSLDWWIWDSWFEDNGYGVTNYYGRSTSERGAGNFHVYRSTFHRSTVADTGIHNTHFFSVNHSVSVGSRQFFRANGPLSASSNITLAGNRVVDPTGIPVEILNPGPLTMLGNDFRVSGKPVVNMREFVAYLDVLAVGNRYSVDAPYTLYATNATKVRLYELDNQQVAASAISTALPSPTPFAPRIARRVFEVALPVNQASLQAAIDQAVASGETRPVVHVPQGTHLLAGTVRIPANTDMQLIGDGFIDYQNGSSLRWSGATGGTMLEVAGPTRATLRDLNIAGMQVAGTLLKVSGVDQAGARVALDQVAVRQMTEATDGGLYVDGLAQARVQATALYHTDNRATSVRVRGGGGVSKVNVFGGLSTNNFNAYEVTDGGDLFVQGMWYEGRSEQFLKLRGSGRFTLQSSNAAPDGYPRHDHPTLGAVDVVGFNGVASFVSTQIRGFALAGGDASTEMLIAGTLMRTLNVNPIQTTGSPALSVLGTHKLEQRTTGHLYTQLANQGDLSPQRMRRFLAQSLAAVPEPLAPLAAGVTDLRMHRVSMLQAGGIGLHITR